MVKKSQRFFTTNIHTMQPQQISMNSFSSARLKICLKHFNMAFCSRSSGLVKTATSGRSNPMPAISIMAPMQSSKTIPARHHLSRGLKRRLMPFIISQRKKDRICKNSPYLPQTVKSAPISLPSLPRLRAGESAAREKFPFSGSFIFGSAKSPFFSTP